MNQDEIKKTILFFALAVFDEKRAKKLSKKAISLFAGALKLGLKKRTRTEILIEAIHKVVISKEFKLSQNISSATASPNVIWPSDLDPSSWRAMQRAVSGEGLEAIIFREILGFQIAEIASGIGVPEGSVKYRVSHALMKLGELTRIERAYGKEPQI